MSAIQLGDKQITLEDLDSILVGKSPISVSDAYIAKIQKLPKGKRPRVDSAKIDKVELPPLEGISRASLMFSLLSLLRSEGISQELVHGLVNAINKGEETAVNVLTLPEEIAPLKGENVALNDFECETLNKLSPRTTAMCYLIFKQVDRLNTLLLCGSGLLIAASGIKIDALSDTVYEVDHPHHSAAYVSQMLRLFLFGASNLKKEANDIVEPLPELLAPLYDYIKPFKLALQAEINAPPTHRGSAILLSHVRNIDLQVQDITNHILLMAKTAGIQEDISAKVDEITAGIASLGSLDRSLQLPYALLLRIQALETLLSLCFNHTIHTLETLANEASQASQAKQEKQEKQGKPENQEKAAEARASHVTPDASADAQWDEATLAKIQAKRAAKEAKRAAKASQKAQKKVNFGLGVTPLLQSSRGSEGSSMLSLLEPQLTPLLDSLKSGGVHRKPKLPKGTRDFNGEQMQIRSAMFSTIRGVFVRHGGVELDTPVFEEKDTLMGKYGEDSKLIYDLADQGGELLALRYDLTVPFARYLALYGISNLKRFHIAKVYRRDNPATTKGRFREFTQCDLDIAGSYDPMTADADVISAGIEVYRELGIGGIQVKINHRTLLDGMMEICGVPAGKVRTIGSAIDKLDKEPWESVQFEMVEKKGLPAEVAEKIHEFVEIRGNPWEVAARLESMESLQKHAKAWAALQEMKLLFGYLENLGCLDVISFDLSLARGLDYYTGVIYEVVLVDNPYGVGSIGAGGRYDKLVGMFNSAGKEIPCVGISIGVERVFTILEKKAEASGTLKTGHCDVLVTSAGKGLISQRMKMAAELWRNGVKAEFGYQENPKLPKQLAYALENGINWVIVIGESELKEGKVKVKNLKLHEEITIPIESVVEELVKQGVERNSHFCVCCILDF